MRLRALFDSRVEVPDLADTVRPVSERNCIGAITPGGEQRKENDQAVTPWQSYCHKVNSIRPVLLASVRVQARSPNKIVPPAQREWNAAEGAVQVVGDSMVGSQRDVNQGTTAGGDERACRGQSVRSSEEASNDRGAKGRRNVVVAAGMDPTHKGRRSAVRLFALARWKVVWVQMVGNQWAAHDEWVSRAQACAAGRGPLNASPLEPEPAHREPRTGKPDAGNPPVRFGREGERYNRSSYPHHTSEVISTNVLLSDAPAPKSLRENQLRRIVSTVP